MSGGERTGRSRFYGKYRGLVVDNADPTNRGRLTATVPAVLGDVVSGWALPAAPYAGPDQGLFTVPPAGAGVWIEFEGGDVDYPIWTGCWWGDGQVPTDEGGTGATPPMKILKSSEGLMVVLDDDERTITVSDSNGSNLVKIETQRGEIRIEAAAKTIVEAPLIELVDGSLHPVVFGDLLLQYLNQLVALFNAHLHVGETVAGVVPVTPAPPATPFPPATPSLHSQRVTSG